MYNKIEIESIIHEAIKDLLENDFFLLEKNVIERSITHKLGCYLQSIIGNEYNVDCEYNKSNLSEEDIKKKVIKRFPGNIADKASEKEQRVYPDIIIHNRGKSKNVLIIEVKKSEKLDKYYEYEDYKLKAYTNKGGYLKYDYGILLNLGIGESIGKHKLTWYEDGRSKE